MTTLSAQVGFIVDSFEGDVFTNDPRDPGGPTKFGVTLRTLQYYRRRITGIQTIVCTAEDVKNLSRGEAVDIGVTVFAGESGLALILDPRVRFVALDYAFHAGWSASIKAMQTCCGVTVDGIFGPVSQDAVNRHPSPVQLGLQVLTRRAEAMQVLLQKRPAMKAAYTFGWWKRITTNQRILAA